jgi:hypothetical protein
MTDVFACRILKPGATVGEVVEGTMPELVTLILTDIVTTPGFDADSDCSGFIIINKKYLSELKAAEQALIDANGAIPYPAPVQGAHTVE